MTSILVIEDDLSIQENIVEILELNGYEVHTAHNGLVGVQIAQTQPPDLILCDVTMPYMDGFEVLRVLHSEPATNHIPIIFVTAKADHDAIRSGKALGARDYLTKPFAPANLLDAVQACLNA
jgi:CheY-like chemotaxis protein